MWPFRKNRPAGGGDDALEIIDQAIDFAAERWRYFSRSVVLAPDPGLRDRIGVLPALSSRACTPDSRL